MRRAGLMRNSNTAAKRAVDAPMRHAPPDRRPVVSNQAALRVLRQGAAPTPMVQRKLWIGASNDPLEREADRIADRVVRMPDRGIAASAAPVQVSRKCAACEAEEKLQKKAPGAQGAATAPPSVHATLGASGRALDPAARAFFEPRFGRDFGEVRVHDDATAAESARSVDAKAYTVGSHLVFGAGEFQPAGDAGRQLIAHELAHVVQQEAGPVDGTPAFRGVQLSHPSDRFEREADRVAAQIPRMKDPPATSISRPPRSDVASSASSVRSIQRQPEDAEAAPQPATASQPGAEASHAGEPTQAPSETDDQTRGSKEAATFAIDRLTMLIETALQKAKNPNCSSEDQGKIVDWVNGANNTRFSMRTLFRSGDYDGVVQLAQGENDLYARIRGKCGIP